MQHSKGTVAHSPAATPRTRTLESPIPHKEKGGQKGAENTEIGRFSAEFLEKTTIGAIFS